MSPLRRTTPDSFVADVDALRHQQGRQTSPCSSTVAGALKAAPLGLPRLLPRRLSGRRGMRRRRCNRGRRPSPMRVFARAAASCYRKSTSRRRPAARNAPDDPGQAQPCHDRDRSARLEALRVLLDRRGQDEYELGSPSPRSTPTPGGGLARVVAYLMIPRRTANNTTSAVPWRSSFSMTFARCVATVLGLMMRRSAMALLL